MELTVAIDLIDGLGDMKTKETWADLGCGSGLFTFALAHLLLPESLIYAIDKNPVILDKLPNPKQVTIQQKQIDFVNEPLMTTNLDGILMANSLHFVRDKPSFIPKILPCLKETGRLLLVEYDTDIPNPWVPYPTSYQTLKSLFERLGFANIIKLGERPSRYHKGNMYAILVTLN